MYQTIVCGGLAGVTVWLLKGVLQTEVMTPSLELGFAYLLLACAGIGVFVVSALVVGHPELRKVREIVARRRSRS